MEASCSSSRSAQIFSNTCLTDKVVIFEHFTLTSKSDVIMMIRNRKRSQGDEYSATLLDTLQEGLS